MGEKRAVLMASRNRSSIPNEILEEILSRLCAGDVTRFKIVSKAWRDMISSPNFIRLHLHKSLTVNVNHRLALINPRRESHLLKPTVDLQIDKRIKKCAEYKFSDSSAFSWPYVIGTCDGLVCIIDFEVLSSCEVKRMDITIWNPTTGYSRKIPTKINLRNCLIACYGFGRSEATRDTCKNEFNICDYKLVLGTTNLRSIYFQTMHSIRPFIDSSKWKSSSDVGFGFGSSSSNNNNKEKGLFFLQKRGILFRGALHWPAAFRDGQLLVAYDLERETVSQVCKLPGETRHRAITLGNVLHGCLTSLVHNFGQSELWVMKEYGITESWSKLMILPKGVPYFGRVRSLNFFWVCKDGDYVFGMEGGVNCSLHKIGDKSHRTISYQNRPGSNNVRLVPYVETLFSPPCMNGTSFSV